MYIFMYTYSFFILYTEFHVAECRANFATVAPSTFKVEQALD